MLEFKRLEKQAYSLKEYFENSEISFCDISVGCKFMWRDLFKIDYALYNDTLILKESTKDYENAFYYPMGKDVDGAIDQIELYCKEKNIPLKYCCIDNKTAVKLASRYPFSKIYNDRNWSDYIYEAEKFKTYSGKHYSGQRNHVNKFKKLYPDYRFCELQEKHVPRVAEFLADYKKETEITDWTAKEEANKINELIENAFNLNQVAGFIEVDNKVVGFSLGEIVGDTLIVHIEKGLREYEGVYPTLAQNFAIAFADQKVKFINREEDCGDMGLRVSKLQYHPIEVKEKNFVGVFTAFDKIKEPKIITQNLVIKDIEEKDKEDYFKLCSDLELNKYFGYDYREDLKTEPTPDYFFNFQKGLKEKKEEYDFGVYLENKLIGEVCLYNFDIYGNAEFGFRILSCYQGKGYGKQSANGIVNYAINELKVKKVKAKAYKVNQRSVSVISSLGFNQIKDDGKMLYFEKSAIGKN